MRLKASEKKGIAVLLILLTCLFVFPQMFRESGVPFFLLVAPENDSGTIEVPPLVQKDTFSPVELNSADSNALVRIRGIGPYYAGKILRYRNQLGGFYRKEQLKEITFNHLKIDTLLHLFTVNPAKITKKDLDTMSFRSVLRHPYLEYEDVVLIFEAKRKWEKINYAVLEEKGVLPVHKLRKVKPYFR